MVACWGRPPTLKSEDCDVQPLTARDFAGEGVSVMVSMHFTNLMKVVGVVAELNAKKGVPSEKEVQDIVALLCDWQRGLPDELRLYNNVNDARRPFHRYTSELYIHYFATIILVQMLSKDRQSPWRIAPASILAASCIAHLYDEIHCREESVHLLSINGFLALVAAIVLVFFRPHSSEKEAIRRNDIGNICSVLGVMCNKYGGARLVLKKIQGLELQHDAERRDFAAHTTSNSYQNGGGGASSCAPWVARSVHGQLNELFPFPRSLCDNMDILKPAGIRSDHLSLGEAFAADHGLFAHQQLSDNMFSLMDILDMNFDAFGPHE